MPDRAAWPRISIVTPSFNQGDYIEETIRSVLLQGYPNLEYLVMDGGSTDRTVAVIRKYEPWLTHWVSEPDRGQSDALNKGLARCTGEIFNWINSDDLLCPGALAAVATAWARAPGSVIAGRVVNFEPGRAERLIVPEGIDVESLLLQVNRKGEVAFCHQPGAFLPLKALKELGGLRTDLHYNMDRYAMVRLLERCRIVYAPDVLARFRVHPAAKTTASPTKSHYEWERVLRTFSPPPSGITGNAMEAALARTRILCAAYGVGEGQFAVACRYFLQAVERAPGAVLAEISSRRFLNGVRQRLGRAGARGRV